MRPSQITGIAIAALFSVTLSAFAQTPTPQTPTTQTAATQTFTGCLMTEPDYRRAHNLGEGTVAGAGLGNEFVLVDVTVSPAKGTAATPSSSDTPAASAATSSTSKCADQGTAYRLTGPTEGKLKDLVGRQLEIQGRFKDPTDPRTGEKLPNEVEVLSFREAPAPVAVTETPAPPMPARTTPPPAVQTTPPPAVQTAPPPQAQTAPPPAQPVPPTTTRTELSRTASSTALLALVGVLALSSGIALTMMRRRAV